MPVYPEEIRTYRKEWGFAGNIDEIHRLKELFKVCF